MMLRRINNHGATCCIDAVGKGMKRICRRHYQATGEAASGRVVTAKQQKKSVEQK